MGSPHCKQKIDFGMMEGSKKWKEIMKTLIRYALGIVLPPAGVLITYGVSSTLLINLLLTFLGWLPGSIHAVWAIAKHEEKLSPEKL